MAASLVSGRHENHGWHVSGCTAWAVLLTIAKSKVILSRKQGESSGIVDEKIILEKAKEAAEAERGRAKAKCKEFKRKNFREPSGKEKKKINGRESAGEV